MRELAALLNTMREAGVITAYALFGATAQMRYTEPVATFDADVLVAVADPDRPDVLTPLYEFCKQRGYEIDGEAVRVGAWPMQLIPVFDGLTEEAVETAETADFDGVPLRVVDAAHLAVIALTVGRSKDHARILALLESDAVTREEIGQLASRHQLTDVWTRFVRRFLDGDE